MSPINAFTVAALPRIVFGAGVFATVPDEVAALGRKVLIVTGAGSIRATPHWSLLLECLAGRGVGVETLAVRGEPSPALVDQAVAEFKDRGIEVVLAVGGGSAMDAAKAIAGLLRPGNSVMDHLEGVGRGIPYSGPATPFIAVPTTAGTGSEATKNAVLSTRGPEGYKKSFRHDLLIARVAVVDPELLISCPKPVLAPNGMDAFTQLLESLTSTRASAFTDALGWSGLEAFRDGFFDAYEGQGESAALGRSRLAYASLLSGINLAQTGLGVVHGLASPLGAFFPIPHGVVCGTLLAEATAINIQALRGRDAENPALGKYAHAGSLLARRYIAERDEALEALVDILREWTLHLNLPLLSTFGMSKADIPKVVAASGGNSMKTNPLVLTEAEVTEILLRRL